jgi:hypothetical protein
MAQVTWNEIFNQLKQLSEEELKKPALVYNPNQQELEPIVSIGKVNQPYLDFNTGDLLLSIEYIDSDEFLRDEMLI